MDYISIEELTIQLNNTTITESSSTTSAQDVELWGSLLEAIGFTQMPVEFILDSLEAAGVDLEELLEAI